MGYESFDIYATEYDSWFMENSNVLETEVKLTASPCYSHEKVEEPSEGYEKGSYVAITAYKQKTL